VQNSIKIEKAGGKGKTALKIKREGDREGAV
jgi:hypothetical protein